MAYLIMTLQLTVGLMGQNNWSIPKRSIVKKLLQNVSKLYMFFIGQFRFRELVLLDSLLFSGALGLCEDVISESDWLNFKDLVQFVNIWKIKFKIKINNTCAIAIEMLNTNSYKQLKNINCQSSWYQIL